MSISTVAIGLMASYLSAVSLLGISAENYVYGTQYVVINFSYGFATPFVAYLYLPVFFKLGATTAYEVSTQCFNFFFSDNIDLVTSNGKTENCVPNYSVAVQVFQVLCKVARKKKNNFSFELCGGFNFIVFAFPFASLRDPDLGA